MNRDRRPFRTASRCLRRKTSPLRASVNDAIPRCAAHVRRRVAFFANSSVVCQFIGSLVCPLERIRQSSVVDWSIRRRRQAAQPTSPITCMLFVAHRRPSNRIRIECPAFLLFRIVIVFLYMPGSLYNLRFWIGPCSSFCTRHLQYAI